MGLMLLFSRQTATWIIGFFTIKDVYVFNGVQAKGLKKGLSQKPILDF
jgi:hypothetical protein